MKKYFLLVKRMVKKPFVYVICGLMLLFVAFLKGFEIESGQLASIGVVLNQDSKDSSLLLYDSILSQKSNFNFIGFSDYETAEKDLLDGKIQEIWVIPSDFDFLITEFLEKKKISTPIKIVVLENNVMNIFLKEVLFSNVIKKIGPKICSEYVLNNKRYIIQNLTEKDIQNRFFNRIPKEDLFVMGNLNENTIQNSETRIVFIPLRGIFGVLILVCCFGISFCFIKDKQNGLFIWWPSKFVKIGTMGTAFPGTMGTAFADYFREFFYYFSFLLIFSIYVLILIFVSGISNSFLCEFVSIILYTAAVINFTIIVRLICGSIKKEGIVISMIIIFTIIFCPIFIELKSFESISRIFPLFYYLKGISNSSYQLMQIIYFIISGFLSICIRSLQKLKYRLFF